MDRLCEWLTAVTVSETDDAVEMASKANLAPVVFSVNVLVVFRFLVVLPLDTMGGLFHAFSTASALVMSASLLFFKIPVKVALLILTLVLIVSTVAQDRGAAAIVGFRVWPGLLVLSQLLLLGGHPQAMWCVIIGAILWLGLERLEAATSALTLYEGERFEEYGVPEVCACASPPCSIRVQHALASWLDGGIVLVLGCMATRVFWKRTVVLNESLRGSIALVEAAVNSPFGLQERRPEILQGVSPSVPPQLVTAVMVMLEREHQFRAFLPMTLFSTPLSPDLEASIAQLFDDQPGTCHTKPMGLEFSPLDNNLLNEPDARTSPSGWDSKSVERGGSLSSAGGVPADILALSPAISLNRGTSGRELNPIPISALRLPKSASSCDAVVSPPHLSNVLKPSPKHRMKKAPSHVSGLFLPTDAATQSPQSILAQSNPFLPKKSKSSIIVQTAQADTECLDAAADFAVHVLDACRAEGGVMSNLVTLGNRMLVLNTWGFVNKLTNPHRAACASALSIINKMQNAKRVSWSVGCACGSGRLLPVGNDTVKVPILAGSAQKIACVLSELGPHVGSYVLVDERIFSRVRTEFNARIIDAVTPFGEENEELVYELKGLGTGTGTLAEYVTSFSHLRRGRLTEAITSLVAVVRSDPRDKQHRRLLRLALYWRQQYGEEARPYVRKQLQTSWEDFEKAAGGAGMGIDGIDLGATIALERTLGSTLGSSASLHGAHGRISQRGKAKGAAARGEDTESRDSLDDGQLLAEQLQAIRPGRIDESGVPTKFMDARGRSYVRSSTQLGRGAFAEVWLGMADDASMVAVKSLRLIDRSDDNDAPSWCGTASLLSSHVSLTNTQHNSPASGLALAPLGGNRVRTSSPACENKMTEGSILGRRKRDMVHEVTLMTSLRHENVVRYLGCAAEGAYVLVIMEYLPGGSLQGLKSQFGGSFGLAVSRRFVCDIARGLKFIHGEKIVHRDLKPGNVLVTAEGQARLADFGASAELAAASTGVVGTPMYMSPEQATGVASISSDIWSLGITICDLISPTLCYRYEVVSDVVPFMYILGTNTAFMPKVPDDVPDLPASLANECLQREPSKRPDAASVLNHPWLLD
eukprot:Hpha_TRINITY_DN17256_c0_g1::TRINITY_DN17256_c0_g1_i1::g.17872::m.17872